MAVRIPRRRLLVAGALLAAILVFGVTQLLREDWNWARPIVTWSFGRLTGRELVIAGDLRVRLRAQVRVEVRGVEIANASWAGHLPLLTADRLALRFSLSSFLRGAPVFERIEAEGARLALARDANGRGSWSLDARPAAGHLRLPREVLLEQVDLQLTDPARPRGFALHVDVLEGGARGAVHWLAGRGTYQEEPITLRAAFHDLAGDGRPVPMVAQAVAGATHIFARGTAGGEGSARLFDVRLEAEGKSLDEVWRLVGFPLPKSPPFALRGRLSYGEETTRLEGFTLRLGRSDFEGNLTVLTPRDRRMWIDADVTSKAIDLDDIEGFWGRPAREEPKGAAPAPAGAPNSIFPDLRFDFAKLRVADARIRFVADRVQGQTVLDHVRLFATLERGKLDLRPLTLGMSAGILAANASIDAGGDTTQVEAEVQLRGVDLTQLLARAGVKDGAGGTFGGRAELHSQGDSLHAVAQNLNGELGAVLQNGWISDATLELVALHLGGYLRAKLDHDQPGPIRCLVGVFDARAGRLQSRALLLDTEHVRIEGDGEIDFGKETIDVELRQHAKHLTLGALKTPIVIRGPLTARTASLKPGPLLARGGAAIALGAIHPLVALLALVDLGDDDRPGACAEALADYRPIAAGVDPKLSGGRPQPPTVPSESSPR